MIWVVRLLILSFALFVIWSVVPFLVGASYLITSVFWPMPFVVIYPILFLVFGTIGAVVSVLAAIATLNFKWSDLWDDE